MGSEELALRKDTAGGRWRGGQARQGQTRTLEQGGRVAWLTPPTSAPTALNCSQRGKFVEKKKKKVILCESHNLNIQDVVLYTRHSIRIASENE